MLKSGMYLSIIWSITIFCSILRGEIINVPDDFLTIQAAVTEAAQGDTVLVQPGEYNERVSFANQNIVLGSLHLTTGEERYIEETIIDAADINRSAVRISDGLNESTVLDGFTIRNGSTDYGGGIYISMSRPTLRNLIVENNNATNGGGGIYLTRNSNVTVTNSIIRGNTGFIGGGIVVINSSEITIRDCTIEENESNEHGGGLHVTLQGIARLEDVIVQGNIAGMYGGGIHCNSSAQVTLHRVRVLGNTGFPGGGIAVRAEGELRMESVEVVDNTSENLGGGLHVSFGSFSADSCTFTGNYSDYRGGALYMLSGSAELNHCVIYQNENEDEGTLYIQTSNIGITNCTITDNISEIRGEICLSDGGNVGLLNTIVWNELLPVLTTNDQTEDTLSVRYCDISGGLDSLVHDESDEFDWGDGNIDGDPLFVDSDEADYHLTGDSPCIDAGDPESDRDPDHSRADIGAFYFQGNQPPYPTGTIPFITIDEDCGQVIIADLDTLFTDYEDDQFTFDVEPQQGLELQIDEEHILTLEPELNFYGDSIRCGVFAIDERPGEVLHFFVTVTNINDPPIPFSLLYPEDEEFVYCEDTVTFRWEESIDPDPDEEVDWYIFRVELWNWFNREFPEDTLEFMTQEDSLQLCFYDIGGNGGCVALSYKWWVFAISGSDTTESQECFWINVEGTGSVDSEVEVPVEFAINSVFPNPFNSTTTISYSLPITCQISLKLFDLSGREVRSLVGGYIEAGNHSVSMSGEGIASGVYLVKMEAGEKEQVRKVLLVR